MKEVNINFGCQNDLRPGFINLDKKDMDLNCCIPIKDNYVDTIICYHTLEHLLDKDFTIEEFTRILKSNAILKIKLPINGNMYKHKSFYHNRNYFFRLYGYDNSPFDLVKFRKGRHHFKGSVLGDLFNRFRTFIDSLFYNEYYWELRKK